MSDPEQQEKKENKNIEKDDLTNIRIEETPKNKNGPVIKEKEDEIITENQTVQSKNYNITINIKNEIEAMYHDGETMYRNAIIRENRKTSAVRKKKRMIWVFRRRKHRQKKPEEWNYGFPLQVFMALAEPVGPPLSYDTDRNPFILKVFSICGAMLLFTVIFIFFSITVEPIKDFMRSLPGLITLVVCLMLSLMVSYIYCCSSCSRIFPINIILNIIATLATSYMAGFIAIRYAPYIILTAAGVTFLIVIVCILLALTSFDFTKFLLLVIIAMVALAFSSVICAILTLVLGIELTIVRMIILVISSVVSSVMLVIELQMILGGKSVELGEDEYTLGAYLVYSSIIDLFLKILRIAGEAMGDSDWNSD